MTMRRVILALGFVAVTAAFILLRFDVQPIGNNRVVHTDRLTGDVTICDETGCVKPGELRIGFGEPVPKASENPLIKKWDEEQAAKRSAGE